jgi:Rieske Fe-S protein
MSSLPLPPSAPADSPSCATRREFVCEATTFAVGILAGIGVSPAAAAALEVVVRDSASRSGAEVTYPLPAADSASIDRPNWVILVRWQNSVMALGLSCPHQRTPLKWLDDKHRFECPKHESKYQPDGVFVSGRATRSMDRFPLRRDGDSIVVDVSKLYREDTDRAGWESAVLKL